MTLFLLSEPREYVFNDSDHKETFFTTTSAVMLLSGYLVCDSFTSNWQDRSFRKYGVSTLQSRNMTLALELVDRLVSMQVCFIPLSVSSECHERSRNKGLVIEVRSTEN
ncbi:unnamed protein product [Protopolystoma xenopodis]|uniref:Uncharacterized protein n=1 Tax=Protopolystoma xenopodis TaxID=117903 RepID=A0A3S5B6I7_9PLAT|nr:unnamed protein product [Protopolystoma xenopodis]